MAAVERFKLLDLFIRENTEIVGIGDPTIIIDQISMRDDVEQATVLHHANHEIMFAADQSGSGANPCPSILRNFSQASQGMRRQEPLCR